MYRHNATDLDWYSHLSTGFGLSQTYGLLSILVFLKMLCRVGLSGTIRIMFSLRNTSPRLRICRCGVNPHNFHLLDYSQSSELQHHRFSSQGLDSTITRVELLNVRSISNKTFAILSHELDLFMTETWLNAVELCPVSKGFNFLNTIRPWWWSRYYLQK